MEKKDLESKVVLSETGTRVDAVKEWRSSLTAVTTALLLFESITGLMIYLLPFSEVIQFSVVLHTILGVAMLVPALTRHLVNRHEEEQNQ